ncbi:hypothetical protein AURDEDRAFT_116815 [Auricularia subglabra TFB-10046 SS5]|uniref:Cupin type-2 domain-containing protein n=1 Tax=Auricularia subglabra (strain TFB-10046 / SS5) TaxID=717982 RepID=J0DAL3_AURST|nr:hypothetical protein AURDEDRAFT_116815 [Auricularia subglabra TFB-10046 SS5]
MASQTSPFPPVRRVVTGHSLDGTAVVMRDEVLDAKFWNPASANPTYDLYRTDETPAAVAEELNGGWVDNVAVKPGLTSPEGSTFRTFDLAPGSVVPMHGTVTIDYGVILKGEITMVLDDGSKTVLKEHDVVVQRSTMHAWRNESSEWTRMLFVMLPARKITVDGKTLEEERQGV